MVPDRVTTEGQMISAPKHLWYGWVRQKSYNGNKERKDVPKITQMYLKSPSKAVAVLRMDPAPKPGSAPC